MWSERSCEQLHVINAAAEKKQEEVEEKEQEESGGRMEEEKEEEAAEEQSSSPQQTPAADKVGDLAPRILSDQFSHRRRESLCCQ